MSLWGWAKRVNVTVGARGRAGLQFESLHSPAAGGCGREAAPAAVEGTGRPRASWWVHGLEAELLSPWLQHVSVEVGGLVPSVPGAGGDMERQKFQLGVQTTLISRSARLWLSACCRQGGFG